MIEQYMEAIQARIAELRTILQGMDGDTVHKMDLVLGRMAVIADRFCLHKSH